MASKSNLAKLDALTSKKKSSWHQKAKWRKENAAWLDISFKIAVKVLSVLRERGMTQKDLADKIGVSPQYINKIVKGSENLSLETIAALEQALSVDLFFAVVRYRAFAEEHGSIKSP